MLKGVFRFGRFASERGQSSRPVFQGRGRGSDPIFSRHQSVDAIHSPIIGNAASFRPQREPRAIRNHGDVFHPDPVFIENPSGERTFVKQTQIDEQIRVRIDFDRQALSIGTAQPVGCLEISLASCGEDVNPIGNAGKSEYARAAGVPDGIYILAATREGYFQAAYGQRRPDGQGLPIEVNSDTDLFVDLRLFHKGALTGRVLDENGVGMENIPVIAYRARLPLRSEGRGVTDDRGVYRIHGLMPGKYWVRSAPATLEDGSGRLPTFGREAPETKDAFQHRVRLDEDTSFADVRPFTGNLFHLRGRVDCVGGAVQITLSSETMHRTIQGACGAPYDFEGLSPGLYQVLAANESIGGFIEIAVANTTDAAIVPALDLPHVDFPTTRRGAGPANIPVTIFARRVDLSEAGKLEELRTRNLLPGHWEMTAAVGPDQYVEMIENEFTARRGLGQPKPAD